MRVGLFVPCYVDAFHPGVGIATLERLGLEVDYPFDQTCCGQSMTNTGCHAEVVTPCSVGPGRPNGRADVPGVLAHAVTRG